MGLKETFQNLASRMVKNTFGDVAKNALYQMNKAGSFNPATGEHGVAVVTAPITAIFLSVSASATPDQATTMADLREGHLRCLLPTTGLSFAPSPNDTILLDGFRYVVTAVNVDPAKAMFDLRLRRV
jgi:hypothetical protein